MMERQSAKVVSGLRGDRKEGAVKANPILKQKKRPGFEVFRARAANYKLLYKAPQVVTLDPTSGRKVNSYPEHISFRNFTYETDDPEKIEFIMSRSSFGLGKDIWLLEDEQQVIVKESANGLLNQLKVIDPKLIPAELKAQLVQSLGVEVKPGLSLPAA